MGRVAVDEIGVPVGQKEQPNRLSIGVLETKGCSTFHPRQDKNPFSTFPTQPFCSTFLALITTTLLN